MLSNYFCSKYKPLSQVPAENLCTVPDSLITAPVLAVPCSLPGTWTQSAVEKFNELVQADFEVRSLFMFVFLLNFFCLNFFFFAFCYVMLLAVCLFIFPVVCFCFYFVRFYFVCLYICLLV